MSAAGWRPDRPAARGTGFSGRCDPPACLRTRPRIRPRAALLEQRFREDLMFAENRRLRPAIEGEGAWMGGPRCGWPTPPGGRRREAAPRSPIRHGPTRWHHRHQRAGPSVPGDPSPWRLRLLVRPHAGAAAVDDLSKTAGWLLAMAPGCHPTQRSVLGLAHVVECCDWRRVGAAHTGQMPIRVVALDDHPIVVEGVLSLVSRTAPDIELLASATTWPGEPWLAASTASTHVALVDLHLTTDDNRRRRSDLTARGVPVVVLTSELRPVPIQRAVAAGAVGLALKGRPSGPDRRDPAPAGEADVCRVLRPCFRPPQRPHLAAQLAPREVEVLALLADGVPRKLVGSSMEPPVSASTVNTYLNRACARYREMGRHVWSPRDVVRSDRGRPYRRVTRPLGRHTP